MNNPIWWWLISSLKNPFTIEKKLLSFIPYKPGIPVIPINLAGGHGFPLPKKKQAAMEFP